jgi:hypothetical protein
MDHEKLTGKNDESHKKDPWNTGSSPAGWFISLLVRSSSSGKLTQGPGSSRQPGAAEKSTAAWIHHKWGTCPSRSPVVESASSSGMPGPIHINSRIFFIQSVVVQYPNIQVLFVKDKLPDCFMFPPVALAPSLNMSRPSAKLCVSYAGMV